MANYPYYPVNYNQYQNPYMAQPVQQVQQVQQSPGIVWVQGEAGAKSYLVGAGQSVLLMDSESSSFFIKSTDASGMPMPLRVFDYTERKTPGAEVKPSVMDMSAYITREEFKKWADDFKESLKGEVDGEKPFV